MKNLLHWIFRRGGNGRCPFRLFSLGSSWNNGTLDTEPSSLLSLSKTSWTV